MCAMSLVKNAKLSSVQQDPTFDNAMELLTTKQMSTNNQKLKYFFDSHKSSLSDGKLPYRKEISSSNNQLSKIISGDYKEQIEFISDKLDLDASKVSKLIDIFAKKIQNCPSKINSTRNFKLITSTASPLSSFNDDLLLYFISMILQQQKIYYKISLQVLKNPNNDSTLILRKSIIENGHNIIEHLIEDLTFLNSVHNKLSLSSELDHLISNNIISLVIELLSYFIYITLQSEKGFAKSSVLKWFTLMEETNFLSSFAPVSITTETKSSIEALSTIITLLFLDLDFNFGSLDDDATFMSSPTDLNRITGILLNTKTNPIILYAWSIILHRQYTFLEIHKENQLSEQFKKKLASTSFSKHPELLYLDFAAQASELNVCDALINCNDLISFDPILPSILGSFVIAFTPYVEPTDKIVGTISVILRHSSNDIIAKFFDNPFTDELLILLKAKMPQSLNSYLQLISINSNLAAEELRSLPSYISYINSKEFNSKYAIDDQQPELVRLLADINIDIPFESNEELSLLMKKDTKAQILFVDKEKSQTLVMFLYEYNGWSLLGRILKNLSVKISNDSNEKLKSINVILKMLDYVFIDLDKNLIDLIFDSMNAFIDGQHIIDIVFKIFDQALLLKNPKLLVNALSLFNTLSIKGYSYRVWSYLYKSNLFSFKLNGGLVFDLLNKIETTSGSYGFIISLLKLGNTLSSQSLQINDNINTTLKTQVIEYFTILSIKIYENFSVWTYQYDHEKYEIGLNILSFLKRIVQVDVDLTNTSNNGNPIFQIYQSSLKKIINTFLVCDVDDLRSVTPFFSLFEQLSNPTLEIADNCKCGFFLQLFISESFDFATELIKLRLLIQRKLPSNFERELYSNLINLINVYLFNEVYRVDVLKLLTNLICSDWNDNPPSALTHLRGTHSIILLNCLYEDISNSNTSNELKIEILKFFSSVMEKHQKGLSLFLITGETVSNTRSKISMGNFSLFKILKALVLQMVDYSSAFSYHLLHSVSLCISICHDLCSDKEDLEFVDKLLDIIKQNTKKESSDLNVYEIEIIAKTVELLSLYVFVSKGKSKSCEDKIFNFLNDAEFIQSLATKFKIYQRDETYINKISKEFKQFSNDKFKLDQFLIFDNIQNDLILDKSFYDFKLLNSIFTTTDEKWIDLKLKLAKISDEYQVIDSQIHLAKAYGGLVTCFCNINQKEINTEYCLLASSLLKINYEEGIPLLIYNEMYKGRIELAFLIVLTISQSKRSIKDTTLISIITSCLDLLESREIDLIQGLTSLNVDYYKPLLRILLISTSMIKTPEFVSEYSSTLLELFKNIICKSIATLFNSIRNYTLSIPVSEFGGSDIISKQIDDILIILSLTQEFFNLKLGEDLESEVSTILIQSGAYRAVAHLFNSSHLIKVNNEEVFMDYSMAFIYEFTQRKGVASKLLENGIFHLLTESPVAIMIKRGHITPYSSNSTVVNLHKLWVERILPIVLVMVSHFGENIIFTLCQFALTFKEQFKFAIQVWLETDTVLSATMIEETGQIVLLAKILNGLDCYNFVSSELGKPIDEVKLVPGLDTVEERKVFVNALTYLLSHPKYLAMKIGTVDDGMSVSQLTEELISLKESLLS